VTLWGGAGNQQRCGDKQSEPATGSGDDFGHGASISVVYSKEIQNNIPRENQRGSPFPARPSGFT